MNKSARIIDDVAVDVVVGDPAESFHPDIAAEFVPVPAEVAPGWRRNPQTAEWSAPELADAEPPTAEPPKIGPIAFKMLFTPDERIKAKQLRGTDPFIEDFWGLLDDPRTDVVDLGLTSVQQAVTYTLLKVQEAGIAVDIESRQAAILSGQVQ